VDGGCSCAANIKARLEGLSALKELYAVASSWKERAEAYIKRRREAKGASGDRLPLSTLQVRCATLVGRRRGGDFVRRGSCDCVVIGGVRGWFRHGFVWRCRWDGGSRR
jgi:hypothetical protein